MRLLLFSIRLAPGALVVAAGAAVALWLGPRRMEHVRARLPTVDAPALKAAPEPASGPSRGKLIESKGKPGDLPGSWPCFRGPLRDGVGRERVPLAREWDPEGPPVLWSVEVGDGHAGAAVLDGRVYVLDYDEENRADALRCLSLATGEEIWRYSYPVVVRRQHGMSRTVPAVTDRYVVSLGPKCHVTCLDSKTGRFLWGLDLVKDFGTTVPQWYAGQCPLIEEGPSGRHRAIIAPGGKSLMIAVDCETGEIAWRAPNPRGWEMTHISIAPMMFWGIQMYVCGGLRGVAGVSAEDGSLLWEYSGWKANVAWVATPVVVGDDRLFLSAGYNAGSMMLKLKEDEGSFVAEQVFRLDAKVFGSEQHTPVFHKGHLYGVRTNGEFVCMDPDGEILWTSGDERFYKGYGPWLIADEMIYVMDSEGTLTLLEATPAGYRRLARAKVLEGHDSWGPMALAGGRLIVRDAASMVCLDVRRR